MIELTDFTLPTIISKGYSKDTKYNVTCELQQLSYALTELYQGQLERRLHSGTNSLQLNL